VKREKPSQQAVTAPVQFAVRLLKLGVSPLQQPRNCRILRKFARRIVEEVWFVHGAGFCDEGLGALANEEPVIPKSRDNVHLRIVLLVKALDFHDLSP
jgi:hypothetical protein